MQTYSQDERRRRVTWFGAMASAVLLLLLLHTATTRPQQQAGESVASLRPLPSTYTCSEGGVGALPKWFQDSMNGELQTMFDRRELPTPPNPGVEQQHIVPFVTAYRTNSSVAGIKIGRVVVSTCRQSNKGFPLDPLFSAKPSHVRVVVQGLQINITANWWATEAGYYLGGGNYSLAMAGNVTLDRISLDRDDLLHGRAVPSCEGELTVVDQAFTGPSALVEVVKRVSSEPDALGQACEGRERDASNPLASEWEWLGPGPPPVGLRAELNDLLRNLRISVEPFWSLIKDKYHNEEGRKPAAGEGKIFDATMLPKVLRNAAPLSV
ncbi:hypothetical protein EMIHUDRAFT_443543 [Emiliania huxleyi CCMP1516]|uniref:Uncharacterized protein n=2 Tax=Emiliania huxleyi TaxID=2903 RepID=A0A0D3JR08_EMIH1|nr:hypothetical protein EMIHUDRAFT_443543 [Emiliania huxleyi CCMP1516]EOD25943.1 hypothetical protein EMIHUDRAFT_443543 [Emiliania huxleyi CCMP1516]|eukprot:XP_005778372.1 hypothetical protein EMIHUDRAFT_443543 [Emiliania huxleyi CCMP1516]